MAHNNKVRRNVINGENIYQSRNVGLNRNLTRNISNNRYRKSKYPMKTNIIPDLYNKEQGNETHKFDASINGMMKRNYRQNNIEAFDNDSIFSDISTIANERRSYDNNSVDLNNTMDFINKIDKIKNNDRHTSKFLNNNNNRPGFLSQFEEPTFDNPGDPVSSNNVHHKIGRNAYQTKIETERKLALSGGYSKFLKNNDMTYGVVNQENFVHTNMVPFFWKRYWYGLWTKFYYAKKMEFY